MCGESTYLAPKPASCGVVVDERGRVLIGRRAGDPHAGLWDVLGGFLEPGESPEDGLRRELREEIGVECSVGSYLGGFVDSYGDDGDATLNLAFECRIESGEPHPADDVSQLAWFAPAELPAAEEFAFRSSVEILDAWRRGA